MVVHWDVCGLQCRSRDANPVKIVNCVARAKAERTAACKCGEIAQSKKVPTALVAYFVEDFSTFAPLLLQDPWTKQRVLQRGSLMFSALYGEMGRSVGRAREREAQGWAIALDARPRERKGAATYTRNILETWGPFFKPCLCVKRKRPAVQSSVHLSRLVLCAADTGAAAKFVHSRIANTVPFPHGPTQSLSSGSLVTVPGTVVHESSHEILCSA
jgi:hypothetical protein